MNAQEKKQNKLIPLLEFVLEQINNHFNMSYSDQYSADQDLIQKIANYAKFLSQPLNISQFVPCDEEGNILEEPLETDMFLSDEEEEVYEYELEAYNKAKSNVLFEGWKQSKMNKDIVFNEDFEINLMTLDCGQFLDGGYIDFRLIGNTICQLADVIRGLTLTENAVKLINV